MNDLLTFLGSNDTLKRTVVDWFVLLIVVFIIGVVLNTLVRKSLDYIFAWAREKAGLKWDGKERRETPGSIIRFDKETMTMFITIAEKQSAVLQEIRDLIKSHDAQLYRNCAVLEHNKNILERLEKQNL